MLNQNLLASLMSFESCKRKFCARIVAKIIYVTKPRIIEVLSKNIQNSLGTMNSTTIVGKPAFNHFISHQCGFAKHWEQIFRSVFHFTIAPDELLSNHLFLLGNAIASTSFGSMSL